MRTYIISGLLLLAVSLQGQEGKATMTRIQPINVTAKVIGVLEGHKSMAVIQVMEADSNNRYELEPREEILVDFYFGTEPVSDPKLPGITGGEVIRAEIAAKPNSSTGQYDYRILRYSLRPKETPSSQEAPPPQK